jgi:allantoicase
VDLDTSHFTGNFPPSASIEACCVDNDDPDATTTWAPLLAPVNLHGNSHHYFALDGARAVTHVRVNLFPDGGLARLRLYGTPEFDAGATDDEGLVDLVAAIQGGTVVAANNEHFGLAASLLLPGRGVNMGDGWETRRRREPGHDWCILALARPGVISAIEVDTCHFKGNFPDRCSIQAAAVVGGTAESLVTQSMFWAALLPEQTLRMDHQHHFRSEILSHAAVTHVRFNIHPDGGVSRLRLRGRPA